MASSATQPECTRKQQLIINLRAVMNEIVALSIRELEAAIAHDSDLLDTLGRRLEMARKRKDDLLVEYRGHVGNHRC